jgi:16S rRNA (cytidine1402-2'-O)-methyltransferase
VHRESEQVIGGTLYVVATPIGNLGDITLRALEVLRGVDVVAAEDTRDSGRLLNHYGIAAKLVALHEHNERSAGAKILNLLGEGKSVALISDAGTPAISDPGAHLVAAARAAGFKTVPLPGANAAIAALSAAGLPDAHFLFYGFLPHSAAERRRALETLKTLPDLLVFYESPHRILACVADLHTVLGGVRRITFARELTKLYETIHTCSLEEAPAWLDADPNRQKGEFVLLLSGAEIVKDESIGEEARRTLEVLLAELPLKQAVKLAAEISGEKKNALYELALALKKS